MFRAGIKKRFRHGDAQSGSVPLGCTRDQGRGHPLSVVAWDRLFCDGISTNRASTFKLLIGTILGLGHLLDDGQALSKGQ